MHAGAGLGDDAFFSHPPRQQDLAEHVVDLVRAGVIEFLALEIDFGAAARKAGGRLSTMRGEPLGEIERRRPADIMRQVAVHLRLEFGIGLRLRVSFLQLQDERHQRLGDEAAAIDAEMPVLIRPGAEGIELLHGHASPNFLTPPDGPRCSVPRCANEGADLFGILLSRRALDARRDIDAGSARDAQSLADIAGIEAARRA